MQNAKCRMQNDKCARRTAKFWLAAVAAAIALTAPAEVVVTNLTAQNWQGRMGEAMGAFARARNQRDRKVYLDALDTALYIATNCPGMDEKTKLRKLAGYGFDLANAMGRDGYAVGWREGQRLALLENAAANCENPARRFDAAYLLAKRRCLLCPDDELPKAEEALKALLLDPAQDAAARLETLRTMYSAGLTFDIDVLATAAKIKEQTDDPAAHLKYYTAMSSYMSDMYGGWEWGNEQPGYDSLNPAYSYEARVALMDKGLADPKVDNKLSLLIQKAGLLVRLERWTEAEQIYLSMTANTNIADRADAYVNYARFLENRAKRYYTPAWRPYLRQASAAYQQALALNRDPRTPANWGFREAAVNCAIAARDFGAARSAIGVIVARNKGQTNDFCRVRLGRIAWEEEDWEGVIANYPPVDSPLSVRDDVYTMDDRAKVAKALKVLGREEEELAALKMLTGKADRRWKSYYQFAHDKLAEKLAAKDSGK